MKSLTEVGTSPPNNLVTLHDLVDRKTTTTLVYWEIDPFDLGLNPYSKPLNRKYYPVPIIDNETFIKYLEHLVKIGVLNLIKSLNMVLPYLFYLINKGL